MQNTQVIVIQSNTSNRECYSNVRGKPGFESLLFSV